MQTKIRPDSLARDSRFKRITTEERFSDPRQTGEERKLEDRAEDLDDIAAMATDDRRAQASAY